jgi:hypothetical protein
MSGAKGGATDQNPAPAPPAVNLPNSWAGNAGVLLMAANDYYFFTDANQQASNASDYINDFGNAAGPGGWVKGNC